MISDNQIHNAKILIIDDQKLQIAFLEQVLKKEGYANIHCVTESTAAAETWRSFDPDIVLLDIAMPQVSGFDILSEFKSDRELNHLPVLVLSADKSTEIRQKALQNGATDFLTKPYENIEVLMRIRNMIETRILHSEVKNQAQILEIKVKERTQELNDTRLDIIRRLAQAAEYRDADTGYHILAMSKSSERIARAVGLTADQCELILSASPLHDIGKIGIPDSILLKPARLTPEEFAVMQTHTTIGSRLLSGSTSTIMQMAEVIALTHHEKWDGTGYPKAIKGKTIPIAGRVCALGDVFDALTSPRPYKRAWSVEEAVTELVRQKDKQFEPELVDKFIEVIDDIKAIRDQYKD